MLGERKMKRNVARSLWFVKAALSQSFLAWTIAFSEGTAEAVVGVTRSKSTAERYNLFQPQYMLKELS